MDSIVRQFRVEGELAVWGRFGQGHINETYIFTCSTGSTYLLQKISSAAFKKPGELMANISAVCAYLEGRLGERRASMHLVPTLDGESYYRDGSGDCWRVYEFVTGSLCLQRAASPVELYRTALAFGRFQRELADFPVDSLYETIPDFHNTPARYRALHKALYADICGRAALCREETAFALEREAQAGQIVDAMASGLLPVRVTHNDTKLNNILLDYKTHEPLCVIDLDTVMPGSSLYDFGDLIRFGASTAAEDETDLSRVTLSTELFAMAVRGFLEGCGDSLTATEISMLPVGAKLMTLECGVRFLADYLQGDVYFRVHRETHNLDRCRTQFKLASDMERKWDALSEIVKEEQLELSGH